MTSLKHLPHRRFLPPLLPIQQAATQPAPAAAAATQGAQLGSRLLRNCTNGPGRVGGRGVPWVCWDARLRRERTQMPPATAVATPGTHEIV
jgi:hypothetical protein